MAEIRKFSLIEELKKADEALQGSPSLLGMTSLTYPNYINSMRSTMFTSHLKQFLNLENPDFPFVFTGNENTVGKYSTGYKKAKGNLKVYKKIVKFEDDTESIITDGHEPTVYKLFVFDEDAKKYDVIDRKVCADLTENFGFDYNNDFIDSLNEGDEVKKDTVLYKSHSYDEDMNYSYGANVTVAYTLDPWTSEDAAVASESMCKKFTSIETETIRIGLNNNDYLLNIYGDDHDYVPLPKIGQIVSDKIAVVRRQFNNQLLFDFADKNLHQIHDGDDIYYIDKNVQVIDYTIYNNNEEDPNNPFYEELMKIYHSENKYYSQIIETCEEIINSGFEYSQEIDYLYKRSKEMVDRKKKWKEKDSIFGNMILEIKIRREVPLAKGCKITG